MLRWDSCPAPETARRYLEIDAKTLRRLTVDESLVAAGTVVGLPAMSTEHALRSSRRTSERKRDSAGLNEMHQPVGSEASARSSAVRGGAIGAGGVGATAMPRYSLGPSD